MEILSGETLDRLKSFTPSCHRFFAVTGFSLACAEHLNLHKKLYRPPYREPGRTAKVARGD
jgi:hypothetical protein